ncbi:hypothetical protein BKP45_09145 [Anaerobacillus alkalidiazotrophicus]|uniref:C-type cytochrome biogenesis protein CcmI n=1 Tax=Anaerobacillus alkalidiazotrophicus TaxID=472963 RepID=A0A1S2M6W5_9BACI|nr:hypothetical protein [Anaerobacillus alkalidiazotrophicus]OIJ20404.1 hypothetical protein BKP45_09145 [Anaerobacillus alkalidiazotrophicus]
MAYIVALLITAFCLYLVISPLLRPKVEMEAVTIVDDMDDISLKNIYATLNELEMDYHMQKLSDEDYTRLKVEYEKLAAEYISKENREKTKVTINQNDNLVKDIEAEIEEELAKLRKERREE